MKKLYTFLKMNRILSSLMMGILVCSLFSSGKAYGQDAIAINCGSDTDYTAVDGTVYVADTYFDGGRTDNSFTGPLYTGDILGTEDDDLYKTYRATGYNPGQNFSYNIPVASGAYNVTLKFADYQQWQRNAGNLIIEGTELLTSYVVQDEAGGPFTAHDITFTVSVEDGELNMQFINDDVSVGDFFINGMIIEEDVPVVLGINCGSDTDYTAVDGQVYVADVYFDGGRTDNSFTGPLYTGDILGTEDDDLYKTYRATGYNPGQNFSYNIPLDNGTYNVTFKFADYQQWQRNAGNLIIEGSQLLTSFLVQDEAGGPFTALDTTFIVIIEDGELNLQFINDDASVGDFFLNGLLIEEDVPFTLGINCGSDKDYTALDGKVYVADIYSNGGSAGNDNNGPNYDPNDPVLGTDDDSLYVYYRRTEYTELTDFSYDIPLENGPYEVTLKFWDFHQWQRNAGNVLIEGTQVMTGFEPTPLFTAQDTTFTITVEDGELNMQFINDDVSVGFFVLNGIYIQELDEIIYTLETIAENGTITLDPVGGSYSEGTEVSLTAEADYGFEFVGWTGDTEGVADTTVSTITVVMDNAKSVTAVFEELPMYTLTTNIQNGIIYLDPKPDASDNRYFEGAEVNLIVTPYVGYQFVEWTGDLSGSVTPTKIVMDADKNVTAVIEEIPAYSITITPPTNGAVQLLPNKTVYSPGEAVVIVANADAGYRFSAWGGTLAGRENPTSVTMNEDLTVSVTFELIPASYTLTIDATTNGSISVDPLGGTFEDGTEVTLTAVPDEGYVFEAWGGDASGTDNPMTLTMSADMTVSATFVLETGIENNANRAQAGLMQNYPNPFSFETTIPYQLNEASEVRLSVFNSLGQKVSTLVNDYQPAGNYTINWNAQDAHGKQLESGLYIFRLEIGNDIVQVKRSALIR